MYIIIQNRTDNVHSTKQTNKCKQYNETRPRTRSLCLQSCTTLYATITLQCINVRGLIPWTVSSTVDCGLVTVREAGASINDQFHIM